jgi:hypothetical protein
MTLGPDLTSKYQTRMKGPSRDEHNIVVCFLSVTNLKIIFPPSAPLTLPETTFPQRWMPIHWSLER